VRTILDTPPIPRLVPDGVFDAFGWCRSETLEWRSPGGWHLGAGSAELTDDNPPHMVFVMKRDLPFLPRELTSLHVGRATHLGPEDEWALAPYGIDDATDGLHEHRLPPSEALWLAADSLAGLFWGLHDWAHFHSHGSFEQRAWTELQCDVTALAWLWLNRARLGLASAVWESVRADAERIGRGRFIAEGLAVPSGAFEPARVQGWVG
jgi:hypothetical protein